MLKRSLYTAKQMFKHRVKLKEIKNYGLLDSVINLTPEYLAKHNIKYLALDFDGVLASHGKPKIYPEVKIWLDEFVKSFAEENIFILSNKPTDIRLQYFKENYPKIRFISGVAKKPYPDGLLKVKELVASEANQVALVDDRLLTGCLACIIAGCFSILITKPYVDRENYDKSEKFFNFLRKLEQKLFL